MRVFHELTDIQMTEPVVCCLGNFDGVHIGHMELLRRTVARAKEAGLAPAVFTFSTHPRNLFGKEPVKNILYPKDKLRILEEQGIQYVFDVPFTMDICTMPPLAFLDELLVRKFRSKELVCGFDYTFGYKAEGDADLLVTEGEKRGLAVLIVEPVLCDGEVVSSTLIREWIAAGDMEKAERFLGRSYSIDGTVLMGERLGRTIGFPTCNFHVDETMVTPPNGVYITTCTLDGQDWPSITNVGVKPTIGKFTKNIETHIFDFSREIYGETIRVHFLKKLRDERKFDSLEALKEEIARNCETAREYHGLK